MGADKIRVSGIVLDVLPSDKFRVQLENSTEIIGYISGKIRMNKIKIIPGDKVEVELSVYDLTKGRIVYRH
jgi:translation initiation factor IF-1